MDIVQDASTATDLTNVEMLDMRKMYENERATNKFIHPAQKDFEEWQKISNRMLPNARELCEQLRLILEPTKCTRLRGDYRTGRRINMKKVRNLLFFLDGNVQWSLIYFDISYLDHPIYRITISKRQNLVAPNKACSTRLQNLDCNRRFQVHGLQQLQRTNTASHRVSISGPYTVGKRPFKYIIIW